MKIKEIFVEFNKEILEIEERSAKDRENKGIEEIVPGQLRDADKKKAKIIPLKINKL